MRTHCPILPAYSSRAALLKLADFGKLIRGNANRGYYDPEFYSGTCKICGREVIITVHTGDNGIGYSMAHYESPAQREWIVGSLGLV
ncbi:unnamed protein product [Sphagnum tenellum]